MVQERETGTYEITTTADVVNGPGTDALILDVEVDKTAYLTSLTVAADNPAQVRLVVRDQDGSNQEDARIYEVPGADSINDSGDVTNPLVKVPAGREIAAIVSDSVSGDVSTSLTLQELAD
jgi:hypothetical protein